MKEREIEKKKKKKRKKKEVIKQPEVLVVSIALLIGNTSNSGSGLVACRGSKQPKQKSRTPDEGGK